MSEKTNTAQQGKEYGYGRVSTADQNIEQQLIPLREIGCDEIFTDIGVSGKKFKREGLDELLAKLKPGDRVNVHRLDRLGRSVYHLAKLQHLFERKGIRFRSLTQGMDITTAGGKLIFYIFATFAEFESNLNGERTKSGLKVRRDNGTRLGRKPLLSTGDARAARRMAENNDLTITVIAGMFKVSSRTMRRALKRLEEDTV